MVLLQWPDATYPHGLITGLPAVGFAPCYGIFPELAVPRTTFEEVLGSWQEDNAHILRSLKAGKDDEFLLAQSLADASQGFCSAPMTRSQLLEALKGASHRLIPRCVITQSSGKQRIIDDAAKGGQSASSSDSNKLVLCTPMRPAQHIQSLLSSMSGDNLRHCREGDSLESGGEDWPNAYRHSPMGTREAHGCVVVFWHHEWQMPAFQLYAGLLFGLPLAVTSFNRYSKFVEACGRRLLSVLVSMYFDDATITDWASSKGSGQQAFGHLNQLLGTPFAAEKRQAMGPTGVFLGLEHDFTNTLSTGSVAFWAKDKLVQKLQGIITDSKRHQTLPPGVAAKLYGLANFFEQGVFGRIGCGSLHAIKERQYERHSLLTSALQSCFAILDAICSSRPRRLFPVLPLPHPRFCAASDAALEQPKQGTGGFLIVWLDGHTELREGFVSVIPEELYTLWTPGDHKIAQLELVQILYALIARPSSFRGRRGIWMIDNTASLMSLIRGRSDSQDLEILSHMIHSILFALKVWIYWEWVPSKSNWADAISRLGAQDPWSVTNQFSIHSASIPLFLWILPFRALILLFEFL